MNKRLCAGVGVVSLVLTVNAFAVPDSCDAFGLLEGTYATSAADSTFTGESAKDFYGRSVVTMDINNDGVDDLIVGAPGDDTNGGAAGVVYIHYGPMTDGVTADGSTADVTLYGANFNDSAGFDVANARDLDADGVDDLIIGSLPSTRADNSGIAYIVYGSASLSGDIDLQTEADAVITNAGPYGAGFSSVVAGVGDVNNDGFDDVAVSSPTSADGGAVMVFFGPVLGNVLAEASYDAKISSTNNGASFGIAVDYVGDVTGDGIDDLAIGSARHDGNGTNSGGVFVFSGDASMGGNISDLEAGFILWGDLYDRAGASIGWAGDLDGDSINDIWVGSKQWSSTKRGSVDLLLSSVTYGTGEHVIRSTATTSLQGENSNDLVGSSVDGTGDFNNDGYLDIIVGGERGDGAVLQTGAAWVVHGPLEDVGTLNLSGADFKLAGDAFKDFLGADVAAASDLNGDGYDDAFIPAWRSSPSLTKQGQVLMFLGGEDVADEVDWYADGDADGYGDPADMVTQCTQPTGYVDNDKDCGPADGDYYPGAPEGCSDPDYNCDGFTGSVDNDGDGFDACDECDDGDAAINPDADEVCGDSTDNDCDGGIDDANAVDAVTFYPDADGDDYGDRNLGVTACEDPGTFLVATVTTGGDCDDLDSAVSPGAFEVCDFVDNNCDDETDESTALDAALWFADSDADDEGDFKVSQYACEQPAGYVANAKDCNDADDTIVSSAGEDCDFQDNDCNGMFYLGGPVDGDSARQNAMGEVLNDRLGETVGFLSDQNADGYDELVTASLSNSNQASESGALYVMFGSATGVGDLDLSTARVDGSGYWDIKIEGSRVGSFFGSSFTQGDLNGDGTMDLIAGAYGARVPSFETGAAYVFYGGLAKGDYLDTDADFIFKGGSQSDQAGLSVASGDLDGDGTDDLVMGVPGHDDTYGDQGGVFVMFGGSLSGEDVVSGADAYMVGDGDGELWGITSLVMDVNGDGAADLVSGNPRAGALDQGSVAVKYGPLTAGANTPDVVLTGTSGGDSLGWSLANAGDVNGDGSDDLLIGSSNNAGYLVFGSGSLSSSDINTAADYIFAGEVSQRLAESVSGAGDLNSDGFDDFLLSAHRDDDTGNNAGAVIVVFGQASFDAYATNGVIQANDVEGAGRVDDGTTFPTYSASNLGYYEGGKLRGENAGDQFGKPAAGGGDFNGDGVPDVAVGAPRFDADATNEDVGKAYVFFSGVHGIDNDADVPPGNLGNYTADADCDEFFDENGTTFDTCAFNVPTCINLATPADSVLGGALTSTSPVLNDCDDADATVYPGAPETEGDGKDADCDGFDNPNNLPDVSVNITPTSPTTSDDLTANVTATDADGESLTITYQWYVDGAEVVGATASTISNNNYAKGQSVEVQVMVTDGRDTVGPETDSEIIENAIPTIDGCEVTPANGGIADDFEGNATGQTDDDAADTVSVTYQWQMRFGPIWTDITGETGTILEACQTRNYSGSAFNCGVGDSLQLLCLPNDGSDFGEELASPTVVIQNTLPVIDSCVITNATADTNDTITGVASASDVDGDTVTIDYTWLINGVDAGVTGTVLASTNTEAFDNIQLQCTPRDENAGAGTTVTSSPLGISNNPPTAPTVDLTPNTPTSSDDLTVTITGASTDVDGHAITYSYSWTVDSSPFSNPTYPSTNPDVGSGSTTRGEQWEVTVTPNDGYEDGATDDDSVTIGNSLPSFTSVALTPSTDPQTADTIVAAGVGFVDEDGDTEDYVVQWYVNGAALAAQPIELQLASSNFVRDDTIYVSLTARDGFGSGNTETSSTLTVINTAPTAPSVAVRTTPGDSSTVGEDDDLKCNLDTASSDDDGDAVTYTYAWYIDGVVNAETSDQLSASATSYTNVVHCTVLPNDGFENGDLATAATVTVQDLNDPPAATIDAIDRYTNDATVDITGTCTEGLTQCDQVQLFKDGAAQGYASCSGGSYTFSAVSLTAGADASFMTNCIDDAGNYSPDSNTVTSEFCATTDPYEDSGTYGDVGSNPVDEWSTLADNGASVTITANIIGSDSDDWYVVRTSDDVAADNSSLSDAYNVQIDFGAGASDYAFVVHRGASTAAQECSSMSSYDSYDWDYTALSGAGNECAPDGTPGIPGNHSTRNRCTDFTSDYYIHVTREFNSDCQAYSLTVSNGL